MSSTAIDRNFMVDAGASSGKTTMFVALMLALITTGGCALGSPLTGGVQSGGPQLADSLIARLCEESGEVAKAVRRYWQNRWGHGEEVQAAALAKFEQRLGREGRGRSPGS